MITALILQIHSIQ